MPERTYSNFNPSNVSVPTTTETAVIAVSGVTVPYAGATVTLTATFQLTSGTAATAVAVRFRRGSTTGDPLLGEANQISLPSAAGGTDSYTVQLVDTPPELANGSYCVTAQQVAATGNGTVLTATIDAIVTW